MKLYFKEKEKKKLLGSNDCVHDFRLFFTPNWNEKSCGGRREAVAFLLDGIRNQTLTVLSENTQLIIAGNVQQQLGEWSAVAWISSHVGT